MKAENDDEKTITFQLFLLIILWGLATSTFLIQMYNLPPPNPNPVIQKFTDINCKPNPYTYYPLEYNPFNDRMTLIESCVIWIGWFYGLLRILNIFRVIKLKS